MRPGGFRPSARQGWLWAGLVVVLAVGSVLLVRTESFRSWTQEELSRRTGMALEVRKTRVGWPPCLVVEGIDSAGFDAGASSAGLTVQELRLRPRWFGHPGMIVDRPVLHLALDVHGSWLPGFFRRVGDLPSRSLADVSRLTRDWRDRLGLVVRNGTFRWFGADGAIHASFEGVQFEAGSLVHGGTRLYVYALSADRGAIGAGGTPAEDVKREWVATEEKDYVELRRSERAMPPETAGFWEAGP